LAEFFFDPVGLRPYPERVVDLARMRGEVTDRSVDYLNALLRGT